MNLRYFTAAIATAMLIGACTPATPDSSLVINSDTVLIPATGERVTVQFQASESWTATLSDDSWCQIAPESGEAGTATMTIATFPNETVQERHAVITIACGKHKGTIEVIQTEKNAVIPYPGTLEVPADGGTFEVSVDYNIAYQASLDETASGWVSIVSSPVPESKAFKESKVKLDIQRNASGWPREGLLLISSALGTDRIKIVQKGADIFTLSVTEVQVPPQGGEFTVEVSGSMPYHISSIPDWIKESAVQGRTHTFTAEQNPEETERFDVLVFCDEGGVCLPVTLSQEGCPAWASTEFRHQSLFLRFTATWCGWCPRMNKSVKQAQDDYPDKIQHVAIHGGGSSLEFSGANSLMDQYMIQGFPTGIVDGRIEIDNESIKTTARNIVNAAKETESTYGTSTGASIATTLKGNNLDINLRLFFKVPGDYLVTVLLVEDGIIASQTDYDEGVTHTSYVHDNVARYAVTPIKGESVAGVEQFSIRDLKWSVTINEGWNADNVRVLAYVQAAYGDRRKISSANYGDFYVDNCFTVQAGKTLELETE